MTSLSTKKLVEFSHAFAKPIAIMNPKIVLRPSGVDPHARQDESLS
jgi:hypothetical protein